MPVAAVLLLTLLSATPATGAAQGEAGAALSRIRDRVPHPQVAPPLPFPSLTSPRPR